MGKYIYGIINSNADLRMSISEDLPLADCETEEVIYTIAYKDVSALVRESEPLDLMHLRKSLLVNCLLEHQTLSERVMATGVSVIPVKIGTVANDDSEVVSMLKAGYPLIKQVLESIAEKIEIGVAAVWSNFATVIKEVSSEQDIMQFKQTLLSKPEGVSVDDQMQVGVMLKKAIDKKNDLHALRIRKVLNTVSQNSKLHSCMDDKMVLNAAFLLDRAKQPDFDALVLQLDAEYPDRLNYKCVGPLPPYSFYTIEIKQLVFENIDQARLRLGLHSTQVSKAEIKKAHQKMARLAHPDKKTESLEITIEFDEVTTAYNTLCEYCQEDYCSFESAEFKKHSILIKVMD